MLGNTSKSREGRVRKERVREEEPFNRSHRLLPVCLTLWSDTRRANKLIGIPRPLRGVGISEKAEFGLQSALLQRTHVPEEFLIRTCLAQLVDQQFHGFHR